MNKAPPPKSLNAIDSYINRNIEAIISFIVSAVVVSSYILFMPPKYLLPIEIMGDGIIYSAVGVFMLLWNVARYKIRVGVVAGFMVLNVLVRIIIVLLMTPAISIVVNDVDFVQSLNLNATPTGIRISAWVWLALLTVMMGDVVWHVLHFFFETVTMILKVLLKGMHINAFSGFSFDKISLSSTKPSTDPVEVKGDTNIIVLFNDAMDQFNIKVKNRDFKGAKK